MKRQHTASFKAQVVQELLKEEKTITQISAEYEVHPTQLKRWKSIVVDGLPGLFGVPTFFPSKIPSKQVAIHAEDGKKDFILEPMVY